MSDLQSKSGWTELQLKDSDINCTSQNLLKNDSNMMSSKAIIKENKFF